MKALLVKFNSLNEQEVLAEVDVMHYSTAFKMLTPAIEMDNLNEKLKLNRETYSKLDSIKSIMMELGLTFLYFNRGELEYDVKAVITVTASRSYFDIPIKDVKEYYIIVTYNSLKSRVESVLSDLRQGKQSPRYLSIYTYKENMHIRGKEWINTLIEYKNRLADDTYKEILKECRITEENTIETDSIAVNDLQDAIDFYNDKVEAGEIQSTDKIVYNGHIFDILELCGDGLNGISKDIEVLKEEIERALGIIDIIDKELNIA